MVRVHPDPPALLPGFDTRFAQDRLPSRRPRRGGRCKRGAVAQLGEHLLCKQGVTGSIPVSSTSFIRSPCSIVIPPVRISIYVRTGGLTVAVLCHRRAL